jgi:hypothetical protein
MKKVWMITAIVEVALVAAAALAARTGAGSYDVFMPLALVGLSVYGLTSHAVWARK